MQSKIRDADVNITFATANGPITADRSIDTRIPALCEGFSPYVLKDSPPALSIGQRFLEDGYDFVWGRNNKPIFIRPDKEVVEFKLSSRVPFLDDECHPVVVPENLVSALRRSIDNIQEFVSQPCFLLPPKWPWTMLLIPKLNGTWGKMGIDEEEDSEEEEATDDEEVGFDEIDMNPPTEDESESILRNMQGGQNAKGILTRKGGSRHVKSEKFGDHIVADHVIMKKSIETGVDDENVVMFVKDVYTQYRYAYPAESKSSDEIIKGFNHFLRTTDRVGVVYARNSPQFNAAIREYGFVQQTCHIFFFQSRNIYFFKRKSMKKYPAKLRKPTELPEYVGLSRAFWLHVHDLDTDWVMIDCKLDAFSWAGKP